MVDEADESEKGSLQNDIVADVRQVLKESLMDVQPQLEAINA